MGIFHISKSFILGFFLLLRVINLWYYILKQICHYQNALLKYRYAWHVSGQKLESQYVLEVDRSRHRRRSLCLTNASKILVGALVHFTPHTTQRIVKTMPKLFERGGFVNMFMCFLHRMVDSSLFILWWYVQMAVDKWANGKLVLMYMCVCVS